MPARNIFGRIALSATLGLAALLSACGGGGDAEPPQGTLQVSLTDAPSCGFEEVNVTVSMVRVHQSASAGPNDPGWENSLVLEPPRKVNLLDWSNGKLLDLGKVALPVGHYTQVRLVLEDNSWITPGTNSVILQDSLAKVSLETPSALKSGVKLNHPFDITADAQTGLVLDFDACKSVVTKGDGGYMLKPVIGVIAAASSGGINGHVASGMNKTVISAQQNGVVMKSTVPDASGAFTLSPLPASTTGYVVVLTADGRTSAAITGVPVTTGANTLVSTSAAPIALGASGMRTVRGTAGPLAAEAMLRATQTYSAGGPKVEIAFKSADLTTGKYALSVPVAAPLRGSYGTGTLPIALTADTAAAGKYAIEAIAAGYATQSSDADVGTADVMKDFTLH